MTPLLVVADTNRSGVWPAVHADTHPDREKKSNTFSGVGTTFTPVFGAIWRLKVPKWYVPICSSFDTTCFGVSGSERHPFFSVLAELFGSGVRLFTPIFSVS